MQGPTRRVALLTAALAPATFGPLASAGLAQGQAPWPNRPVTVVVPFAAGGNVDVAARIFTDRLTARLGQPFVVENRTGAGGATGLRSVAQANPDGYTLGVASSGTLNILPHIYRQQFGFDPMVDLTLVGQVAYQPNMLVVHPSLPARNMAELIAHLRANPDRYSYGSSGVGTSQHLCMEIIAREADLKVTHVPYRASNQIMQDLIAGRVHMSCDQYSTAIEQVRAGNARAIGVASIARYAPAPEIPSIADTLPGIDITWSAVFIGPRAMPAEAAARLEAALREITQEPAIIQRLNAIGVTPNAIFGAELAGVMRADNARWKPLVERANIPPP